MAAYTVALPGVRGACRERQRGQPRVTTWQGGGCPALHLLLGRQLHATPAEPNPDGQASPQGGSKGQQQALRVPSAHGGSLTCPGSPTSSCAEYRYGHQERVFIHWAVSMRPRRRSRRRTLCLHPRPQRQTQGAQPEGIGLTMEHHRQGGAPVPPTGLGSLLLTLREAHIRGRKATLLH